MPLTADLYPGKFVSINGQTFFQGTKAPSYNGTLNKYAGNNLNSTEQYRVFQKDPNGGILSQNQAMINQDIYDLTKKNEDLAFALRNRHTKPNAEEQWELLNPQYRINFRQPNPMTIHPS